MNETDRQEATSSSLLLSRSLLKAPGSVPEAINPKLSVLVALPFLVNALWHYLFNSRYETCGAVLLYEIVMISIHQLTTPRHWQNCPFLKYSQVTLKLLYPFLFSPLTSLISFLTFLHDVQRSTKMIIERLVHQPHCSSGSGRRERWMRLCRIILFTALCSVLHHLLWIGLDICHVE